MQMVNYLARGESQRGEAFWKEGYVGGRPVYEEPTLPPGRVPEQMRVIGLVPQLTPAGLVLVRTVMTNVPPTGG